MSTIDEIDKALAEVSLRQFIRQAWPILEPGTEYLHNWHIDCVCEHLEAVDSGQITRLLVNQPPRCMKSISITVMWPAWAWIKRPELQWMFTSYAANLSTQHSVDRRTIIESDWYQDRWRDRYRLMSDQNVKTEYLNSRRGRMFATSFGGIATGKGGDRLVCDDPHDPNEVESDVQRDTATRVFRRKFSTRLNNKKTGAIVVVMQRLHTRDISAICMDEGYVHLKLPAIDDPRKTIVGPLGRKYVRSDTGLLWPEREGHKEIEQAKKQLTPTGFAGQYQQEPVAAGGNRFRGVDFRYFRRLPGNLYELLNANGERIKVVNESECRRFAVADPAGAEKEQDNKPCYTCCMVWDVTPDNDMLLLHNYREQSSVPQAEQAIFQLYMRWQPGYIGVEKNGIGLGVVQHLTLRGIPVLPILAQGSKEARSETAEIRVAAHTVYFEEKAAYLHDLESELLAFPNGEFLDQADVLSYSARQVLTETGSVADGQTTGGAGVVVRTSGRYKRAF